MILLEPDIARNSYTLYLFFQFSYLIFLSYNTLNSNLDEYVDYSDYLTVTNGILYLPTLIKCGKMVHVSGFVYDLNYSDESTSLFRISN